MQEGMERLPSRTKMQIKEGLENQRKEVGRESEVIHGEIARSTQKAKEERCEAKLRVALAVPEGVTTYPFSLELLSPWNSLIVCW